MGKIRSDTRTILKDPRLPYPKIHQATLIDEVVLNAQYKTGMRLRPFICRGRQFQLTVRLIYIVMSLRLTRNAIALMKPRIEPLRRIGHTGLVEDAVNQLLIKYLGILRTIEIAIPLAPYAPAICHAMRHLFDRGLTTQRTVRLRNARLPEIFLRKDIGSDLTPPGRDLHIIHFKYDLPAGIPDHRCPVVVPKLFKHIGVFPGEAAGEL